MNIMTTILAASAVIFAATAAEPVKKQKMSAEEIKAWVQAHLAADGGFIDRPVKGKVIRIKVETDRIAMDDVKAVAASAKNLLQAPVEVVGKGENPPSKVGAYVALVEQGEKAPALLCAPEDFWATVNVTRLLAGEPDAQTLKIRIIAELWRGLAYALGAANSMQQPSVMRPIRTAGELDAEVQKFSGLSQQTVMAIRNSVSMMGFEKCGRTTYRKACEEGWAPSPTNDVQKAVWDKVHELPKEPLKIKPETKKVAE